MADIFQNDVPITVQTGAYNIYRGARYVPKMEGEWKNNVNYEPLSIVTYQGNIYTSRGAVPAGTLPTNETYWAITGEFNAQVEALQKSVDRLTQRPCAILTDQLGIGDGNFTTRMTTVKRPHQFAALSGVGFATTQGTFQNVLDLISDDFKQKLTDIYIVSGCNDYQTISGLSLGMGKFQDYALSKCPYLQHIYIVPVGCGPRNSCLGGFLTRSYGGSVGSHITVVPESFWCMRGEINFSSDYSTLNLNGQTMLGYFMTSLLRGNVNVNHPELTISGTGIVTKWYEGFLNIVYYSTLNISETWTANTNKVLLTLSPGTNTNLPSQTTTNLIRLGSLTIMSTNNTYPVALLMSGNQLVIRGFIDIPAGLYHITGQLNIPAITLTN